MAKLSDVIKDEKEREWIWFVVRIFNGRIINVKELRSTNQGNG